VFYDLSFRTVFCFTKPDYYLIQITSPHLIWINKVLMQVIKLRFNKK
jgi:hypothetical protein